MMRILLYSDLHISRTSSIFPLNSSNPKYTYRQQMIIETAEWLSQIMVNEKPDLIINCGDTFDQHTVTSYDIDVASEFFQIFTDRMNINNLDIPHLVLVGNHEMINQDFNAIKLLNNISGIQVISEPCTLYDNLAFLPYCNYKDILEYPQGKFLFSHQDIQGSVIRNGFQLPEGIEPSSLKEKYNLVFNGHIHKSSISGNIINLGSVTTHSFSDDEEQVPQAYIFNTDTLDLQAFKNSRCPLFRKFSVKSNLQDLYTFVDSLDKNYKYILHIVCPFEYKDTIKDYLDSNELILNNRLNIQVYKDNKQAETEETKTINLQSNVDIKQSFKDFLDITDLKFPKDLYLNVMEGIE